MTSRASRPAGVLSVRRAGVKGSGSAGSRRGGRHLHGYPLAEVTQKYGLVPVRVARATGEARIQWRYRNVHSTSSEGTGLTAAAETSSDTKERYVIHTLNVTYRLPSDIQLSQRAFDGGQDLDQKCQRKPDGFTCINLDTGSWVRETWHWNVWDSCSAGH